MAPNLNLDTTYTKINEILRTSNDNTMTEATIHNLKSIANYSDSYLKKNNTLIFDRLSNHLFLFLFSTKYLNHVLGIYWNGGTFC